MATRGEILKGIILLMSSLIQVTVCKRSTACAAPQPKDCTQHNLRCSTGDTITIHGGLYGYIACTDQCSTPSSCDDKDCCNIDRKDKLYYFNRDDLRELKSNCTGKTSCLFNSPYFETSCDRFNRSRYLYSIIEYNCVPTLNLNDTSGSNDSTIKDKTVIVKSSNSEVCTCTASSDGLMFRIYQTSDSCDDVVTDRGNADCDTMYKVYSHNAPSTLQFCLNITDVTVELKSDVSAHDIEVNCSCGNLENFHLNVFNSNATMEKVNSTVDNTTMLGENFNTSRRIMNESGISDGGIAGIVIGCLVVILVIIVVVIVIKRCRNSPPSPQLTTSDTGNDDRNIDYLTAISYVNHIPSDNSDLTIATSQNTYDRLDFTESENDISRHIYSS